MKNVRIKIYFDEDCVRCYGRGEIDTATNRQSKKGEVHYTTCPECGGSGTQTVEELFSLKSLLENKELWE